MAYGNWGTSAAFVWTDCESQKNFCYECFRGRALKDVASEIGYDIRLIRSISIGSCLRGPFS